MSEAAKPRRFGRIFLVLSLVLNLLLIGLIVGAVGSGRAGPHRGFEAGLGPISQILPREDRAKIGRDIRRALRNADRHPREIAAAMRDVVSLLEAETFDSDAFVAMVQSQQEWQNVVRQAALTSFVDHINTLSIEERRNVAATLRDRLSRGPGRQDDRK